MKHEEIIKGNICTFNIQHTKRARFQLNRANRAHVLSCWSARLLRYRPCRPCTWVMFVVCGPVFGHHEPERMIWVLVKSPDPNFGKSSYSNNQPNSWRFSVQSRSCKNTRKHSNSCYVMSVASGTVPYFTRSCAETCWTNLVYVDALKLNKELISLC